MSSHDPFGYLKHKLWPKERSWVKLLIWLLTIKNRESLWFPYFQMACHISLKSYWRELQLFFRPHFNQRFAHKVMGLQSCGSPVTKWHLGAGPMAKHKEYYKVEGGGFPQVWAVMNLMSLCLPMVCMCTKSALITD
jgi:hypothetical protein